MAENTTDKTLYTLLESAAGYALFKVVGFDEIAALISDGSGVTDVQRFGRAVKLHAFKPFTTAAEALDNANAISEHAMTETLHNFLELNLATNTSKKSKSSNKPASFVVGVIDPALATAIAEGMNGTVPCRADDTVREILRGCRMHLEVFVKGLSSQQQSAAGATTTTSAQQATALVRAQLGLGHAYSRSKVKFNPARSDNMIIQSIALLDQLDKDINTFAMRVREWYSWHFPELKDLVPDNLMFARAAAVIQNKSSLFQKTKDGKDSGDDDGEEHDKKIAELTSVLGGDTDLAERVVATAKTSMGMDCSLVDMMNICNFSTRMVKLAEYRKQLSVYLSDKMAIVAPNLSTLIGDTVAARLISKAGSLTNLAKAPASTVQILGAEKALFRALKTKGNTPKYGLIYHSTFIGRAGAKNKGRISRYLANKCAIATRIDSFSDDPPSHLYGAKLRDQVEERLQFYETGKAPRRNLDVMQEASREIAAAKKSQDKGDDDDDDDDVSMSSDVDKKEKKKASKKEKKRKSEDTEDVGDEKEVLKKAAKKAKKEDKKKKKKSKK